MSNTTVPDVQRSPERSYNFINHYVPEETRDLVRAIKDGLPPDTAIENITQALPSDTPPDMISAFEQAVEYIDQELKNGGFAFV